MAPPSTRLLVGYEWQPEMLEERIVVAEELVSQQLKWSQDLQHSTLAFIELDKWLERSSLLTQKFKLYDYPDHILQIALVANKDLTLFYLKGARRQ